jgi:hypothetical protein
MKNKRLTRIDILMEDIDGPSLHFQCANLSSVCLNLCDRSIALITNIAWDLSVNRGDIPVSANFSWKTA